MTAVVRGEKQSSAAARSHGVCSSHRVLNLLVKLLEMPQFYLRRSLHYHTSPEFLFARSHTQPAFLGFSETLIFYAKKKKKKEKQSGKVQPPTILHNLKWGALFSSVQAGVIQTETSFGRNFKQGDSSCFDRVQGWQMGINSQKKSFKKKSPLDKKSRPVFHSSGVRTQKPERFNI